MREAFDATEIFPANLSLSSLVADEKKRTQSESRISGVRRSGVAAPAGRGRATRRTGSRHPPDRGNDESVPYEIRSTGPYRAKGYFRSETTHRSRSRHRLRLRKRATTGPSAMRSAAVHIERKWSNGPGAMDPLDHFSYATPRDTPSPTARCLRDAARHLAADSSSVRVPDSGVNSSPWDSY